MLVIDDNTALAEGIGQGLTLAGYAVHTAYRADVALEIAITHRPDAIILDFNLPFINGVGFLYRLRDVLALQRTPVLVITGEALDEETQNVIHALDGRLRYKPISLQDLIHETRTMVECACYNQSPLAHLQ